METFFIVLLLLELIACITGFVYWNKIKGSTWRFFPLYLAFIVVLEITGSYFRYSNMPVAANNLYNYLGVPAEFLFFFLIFRLALKDTKFRRVPVICLAVYGISWLTDTFYFSKLHLWFYSFSYTVGNLLLLVLILCFFILLISSDAILHFKQNMLFWVSAGLLIFYLGTLPYYGLRNTLAYNYKELYISYTYLMFILNWLMYLMFIFSFIWGKPNTKYS